MDDQIVFETLMHISKSLAILDVCIICSQVAFAMSILAFVYIFIRDQIRMHRHKIECASHAKRIN